MKLKVNDEEYLAKFRHLSSIDGHHITICTIDCADGIFEGDKISLSFPVAYGAALCSASDQFSRQKGRALSLSRAMSALMGMEVAFSSISSLRDALKDAKHISWKPLKLAWLNGAGEFMALNPRGTNQALCSIQSK